MREESEFTSARLLRESRAYYEGWEDGRFGPLGAFATNANIGMWQGLDRLAYYRGHREGREVRELLRLRGESA